MTPYKIGACLASQEIATHRKWVFGADRDLALQGFSCRVDLTTEFEDRIAAAKAGLNRCQGGLGTHGPFEGLDMDNKDPDLGSLIATRFL